MKKILLSFLLLFSLFMPTLLPVTASAQQKVDVFNNVCSGNTSDSSICKQSNKTGNPLFGPNGVITFAIKFMSILVGLAAVIMLIVAGLKLVTSGNNPQDVSKAREMIIYSIAGIIIAFMAQIIVQVFLNKVGV